MSQNPVAAIHHITMTASDARSCLGFYRDILGLRLVKKTVNFDDPGTWHLYFGDDLGQPGTILTFFPMQGLSRGRAGICMVTAIRLAVKPGSLVSWIDRIRKAATGSHLPLVEADPLGPPPGDSRTIGLAHAPTLLPTGELALRIYDPDGLALDLVEAPYATSNGIAGIHGILIEVEGFQRTSEVLIQHLGFHLEEQVGSTFRHLGQSSGPGTVVDVRCLPGGVRGRPGAGTVHHLAFRAADDDHQNALQRRLVAAGFNVTPILDRTYFRSLYFREPGGVLFEIATDPPGFGIDESPMALGTSLRLPRELEPRRSSIMAVLPPLESSDS
jgi:glyoxalase family protein